MKHLGTILPTEKSLAANDRYAATRLEVNRQYACKHPILKNLEVCMVGGEVRYYLDSTIYATVRNQKACWFERRPDGLDYAITEENVRANKFGARP